MQQRDTDSAPDAQSKLSMPPPQLAAEKSSYPLLGSPGATTADRHADHHELVLGIDWKSAVFEQAVACLATFDACLRNPDMPGMPAWLVPPPSPVSARQLQAAADAGDLAGAARLLDAWMRVCGEHVQATLADPMQDIIRGARDLPAAGRGWGSRSDADRCRLLAAVYLVSSLELAYNTMGTAIQSLHLGLGAEWPRWQEFCGIQSRLMMWCYEMQQLVGADVRPALGDARVRWAATTHTTLVIVMLLQSVGYAELLHQMGVPARDIADVLCSLDGDAGHYARHLLVQLLCEVELVPHEQVREALAAYVCAAHRCGVELPCEIVCRVAQLKELDQLVQAYLREEEQQEWGTGR